MILSALILGFAGSLHCVGMCSPLIISITSLHKHAVLNRVVYNAGRILMYSVLGLFVSTFSSLFDIFQFQNIITIVLGITLITLGIAEITAIRIPVISGAIVRLMGFIKNKYATFLYRKSAISTFTMGMLNGLLPCGLTYVALTYCLSVESIQQGMTFMLMFGIGTLPAMIGGSSVMMFLAGCFSVRVSKFTTIMLIGAGILLAARPFLTHHHIAADTGKHDNITICR